jgi:hypothetical protein
MSFNHFSNVNVAEQEALLEKQKTLDEFLQKEQQLNKNKIIPGYYFLLDKIKNHYGDNTCPYLNINDPDCFIFRNKWINDLPDKGVFLREIISPLQTPCKHSFPDTFIINLVKETVSLELYDKLIDIINQRQNVKSMNKTFKLIWMEAVNDFDTISKNHNFDFAYFYRIIFDVNLKLKFCISTDTKSHITELLERYEQESLIYFRKISEFNSEKEEALDQLYNLIKNDFKSEQVGKYFKKWSLLDTERRNERITSYCFWFLSYNSLGYKLFDEMFNFIIKGQLKKDKTEASINTAVKPSDIIWNTRLGIIKNIKNLFYKNTLSISVGDDTGGSFVMLRSPIASNTQKRSSNVTSIGKSISGNIPVELTQRIHRLLLFELTKGTILNKANTINNVFKNFHSKRMVNKEAYIKYISQKYDEMVHFISNNSIID